MLFEGFQGTKYRTADNWFKIVPIPSGPIRYLEIGTLNGGNLFSVGTTYAAHPDSRMVCIDPWFEYDEYHEYKKEQFKNYDTFQRNLEASGQKDKITVMRGFSHTEVIKLEDNSFDIIYIDGNHESEYVCEDAVLAFRKLKVGGTMIFDDYWRGGDDDSVKCGVDSFRHAYRNRLSPQQVRFNNQLFVTKIF